MRCIRRGYTIVELLVVIALFGVTLSLVAACLYTILHSTSRFRDEEARSAVLLNLDRQLRTDVHEAIGIGARVPDTNDESLQLVLPDDNGRQIEYQIDGEVVQRVQTSRGGLPQREAYWLGHHVQSHFEVVNDSSTVTSVGLVIECTPGELPPNGPPARVYAIRAVLSRPRQLAQHSR